MVDYESSESVSINNIPTLLIAASDPQLRRHIRTLLSETQFEIVEAEDGQQTLQQVFRCNPDLALVAGSLPTLSGFEVASRLRDLPRYRTLPVIMLLEDDSDESIDRTYESGALDYFSLPPRPAALRQRINILLRMRQQTQELRTRNEELDAFAHSVAHDLKNPIASMMGFTSLVLKYYERMTDDKVREYLELIMESGYKLKEIINSLLLLSGVNRMETVEIKPIDMGDIIYGAQSRMLPMIDEQGAEIIMPPRWPTALGYAPWVEEVWANYLSNALKYGGTPPRIEFGADPDIVDSGKVRFWIQDNGGGLTAEEQQKVFTPFTRLSQAKIEGHGLGLSVVQRIVQRLNGEVGVESQVGVGSRFSFTLPAVRQR